MTATDPRRPRAFAIDDDAAEIHFAAASPEAELAPLPPSFVPAPQRGTAWGLLLTASLAALIALAAVMSIVRLISGLLADMPALGWLAAGLAALALLALVAIIWRETAGFFALDRLEHIQADAEAALSGDQPAAASRCLSGLRRLFLRRADMSWALARLDSHARDIIDPADRIRLAERDLMVPLDEAAAALIARAARSVTVLTAVTPAPALDMLFVAGQNLRLLRQIAGLYGARPGSLGTLRLARMVLSHLAVAGGLALSDSLLQHVLGKGLAGRLSARFGEGAVNGILTARIGLAALDVCRPLPFTAVKKPSLAEFMREIVRFGARDEERAAAKDA